MNDSPEIPRLLPLQDSAMGWMRNSWSSGLSLARNVAISSVWLAWDVFAVTGESNKERLQARDPKYGGLPQADNVAGIAAELSNRFPGKYLIVELALASPDDPWLSEVRAETVTCGKEVYELVEIGSDLDLIEKFLRMIDPAGIYNAFIVTSSIEISSCPGILLQEGKISLFAAIAGAYDGEGFMLAAVATP
jgi:hypothetical protein